MFKVKWPLNSLTRLAIVFLCNRLTLMQMILLHVERAAVNSLLIQNKSYFRRLMCSGHAYSDKPSSNEKTYDSKFLFALYEISFEWDLAFDVWNK